MEESHNDCEMFRCAYQGGIDAGAIADGDEVKVGEQRLGVDAHSLAYLGSPQLVVPGQQRRVPLENAAAANLRPAQYVLPPVILLVHMAYTATRTL